MPPATPKFDFSVLRRLREQHELTLAALSETSGVSLGSSPGELAHAAATRPPARTRTRGPIHPCGSAPTPDVR